MAPVWVEIPPRGRLFRRRTDPPAPCGGRNGLNGPETHGVLSFANGRENHFHNDAAA